jgi:acyl carrier protein
MKDDHQSGPGLSVVEEQVEKIWKDVLGVREGQEDLTFFDLQGQSISAVRIVARIEDELGITVDVGILFDDPNLASFVRRVVTTAAGTMEAHLDEV